MSIDQNQGAIPEKWDREADAVIVGTGYAGLASAITARELGLSVLLIEKMRVPGGNSIISGGGANAVDPPRQKAQGIEDSTDLHFRQTLDGGDQVNDPDKVRYMVDHALNDCVQYLEKLGVAWPEKVLRGYGALHERTHFGGIYTDKSGKTWSKGAANIRAMLDHLEGMKQEILFEHEVARLIRMKPLEGPVLGIEVKARGTRRYFRANKGLILASGGFAADRAWVALHDRRMIDTDTTNHKGATGECIKFAQDIGADTLHMDYIQAIPGPVKPPFKATFFELESEEIRNIASTLSLRVFINREGGRFVDEGARRDLIKFAAFAQSSFEPLGTVTADSIPALEKQLGIPEGNLVKTVARYNAACKTGKDEEFGKAPSILIPLERGSFVAVSKAMMRHHTMGGLRVEGTSGSVLDRWGRVIPHLFAAGEVTGGTHGANRLGHNATVDCIVFGQLCARMLAEEIP
jgi:urocanate reductase